MTNYQKRFGSYVPLSVLVWCLSLIIALGACGRGGEEERDRALRDSLERADTTVVTLALLPTVDCLPFYVAEENGYFKEQGMKVRIVTYASQTDCDTALLGASATFAFTDSARIAYYEKQKHTFDVLGHTNSSYALVCCGRLRLRKLEDTRLRTISALRLTASDRLRLSLLDSMGIKKKDGLSPQIGNLDVRARMLDDNQIDAAILPEPYVTAAVEKRHKVLHRFTDNTPSGRIVAPTHSTQRKDYKKERAALIKAYNMAVATLNGNKRKQILSPLFRNNPDWPQVNVDSIRLPQYQNLKE